MPSQTQALPEVNDDRFVELLWSGELPQNSKCFNNGPVDLEHKPYADFCRSEFRWCANQEHGIPSTVDLLNHIGELGSTIGTTGYADVITHFNKLQFTAEQRKRASDLVARLFSTLQVGSSSGQINRRECKSWTTGTLKDLVRTELVQTPATAEANGKLALSFNAWSLATVGGLEITFTDRVSDHLRLIGNKKVMIFHHASFLEHQRLLGDRAILPNGLAEETLRTLSVMFPEKRYRSSLFSSKAERSWLERLCDTFKDGEHRTVDNRLTQCGTPNMEDRDLTTETYKVWRDRLVILKDIYDDAEPKSLWQWWYDTRSAERWWAFWFAFIALGLTVFFGLAQTVEGAIQVYKAYHPSMSKV